MYNKLKEENGITLMSLVVTVIILMVLAGLTVTLVIGQNGIIGKAKEASAQTMKSKAEEDLKMMLAEYYTSKQTGDTEALKDYLDKQIIAGKIDSEQVNGSNYDVVLEEYICTVDSNTLKIINTSKYSKPFQQQIGSKTIFEYTGNYQEYDIKDTGKYKIQCWGAAGGKSRVNGSIGPNGGNGGYTEGIINLNIGEKLYIYVGEKGKDAVVGQDSPSSYNGGGLGTWDHRDDEAAGAGGGATDVRLKNGICNDFESLKSRIMVAAGGGRRIMDC